MCKRDVVIYWKKSRYSFAFLLFPSLTSHQEVFLQSWSRFHSLRRDFFFAVGSPHSKKVPGPDPLGRFLCAFLCGFSQSWLGLLQVPPTVHLTKKAETCIDVKRVTWEYKEWKGMKILCVCACVREREREVYVRVWLTVWVWFLDFIRQIFQPNLNILILCGGELAQTKERCRQPPWCHCVLSLKSSSGFSYPNSPHNPAGVFGSHTALIRSNTVSVSKPQQKQTWTRHSPSFHSTSLFCFNKNCASLFRTGNELAVFQSGAHNHVQTCTNLLKQGRFLFPGVKERFSGENSINPCVMLKKEPETSPGVCQSLFSTIFGSNRFKSPPLKLMSSAPSHWHPGIL